MNTKIFRQYDGPWAKKPYPTKRCTVSGAGCGLVACTHIAIEQERYKNWTPDTLRPYMLKYAVAGQGTTWNGITKTLQHLGHKVKYITESTPMKDAFAELNKGGRIGIILFYGGYSKRRKKWYRTPDGTVWTGNGHYMMFGNYKYDGNKHWFYMKDSGGRKHDGWYSYEKSMKGCVGQMWIVERIGGNVPKITYKPTTEYKGTLPKYVVKKGTKGADAKAVQSFLNWCINAKLSVDGIAGAKTESAITQYQVTYGLTPDGIFGPSSKAKAQSIINQHKPKTVTKTKGDKIADTAKKYIGKVPYVLGGHDITKGVDCTGFIQEAYRINGIKLDNKLSAWGKSIGTDINKAQRGDIITFKSKKTGKVCHHAIYDGGGYCVHAANPKVDIIRSKVTAVGQPIEGIRRRWK
jgi:cell wall-associated NlpC family hydrolase